MLIGEFARAAGVSPRSLRHYEQTGLLEPRRTSGGYREYAAEDLAAVARIRVMLAAGLGTRAARLYLDCVRDGTDAHHLAMCPDLRAELDRVEARLDREQDRIARTRGALRALESPDPAP